MFDTDYTLAFSCDALPDDVTAEIDAWIDAHNPPPAEEEIDAMYIAEMERRDTQAAGEAA